MNKIIYAISFLHKGERVVVDSNRSGKFKVPVTSVENGSLKTRLKSLTAMEIINHDIIKNCDPTFYLENNQRMRVFPGGDPSYLPAQSEGIATKHDDANKIELPKLKKKLSASQPNKYDYEKAQFDMYGWCPGYDDGNAD